MNPFGAADAMALRFFLLLLAGHVLSDFLFQTERIARDKDRKVGALLVHGLWTYAVHAALLFPFWNGPVLLGLLALAVLHIGIDWLKPFPHGNDGKTLAGFLLDQGTHLATLIALSAVVVLGGHARLAYLEPANLDTFVRAMIIAAGFAFNGKGGTAVVRLLLSRYPDIGQSVRTNRNDAYAMGRAIGVLERLILYGLVLLGHWGAIGFVLAAKSIARFKDLDDKGFADYYLIGTLASVLVALGSGVVVGLLQGLL